MESTSDAPQASATATSSAPPRRRLKAQFRPKGDAGASTALAAPSRSSAVPDPILNDPRLLERVSAALPSNYDFEIPKTVSRLLSVGARRVSLQFPEGLLMFSCVIADLLKEFAQLDFVFVLGDVSYGACCVEDLNAVALGCDFLVHYGHSCLVSVETSKIPILYVFVEISIDVEHFVASVKSNLNKEKTVYLAGTIQFSSAIQAAAAQLKGFFKDLIVPQTRPLSKGEVLGCTAPSLESRQGGADCILFLSDGRFHLESLMIHNPHIEEVYKYDPYSLKFTLERYDHQEMHRIRQAAIAKAREAKKFGLILGTLGRQGNLEILEKLEKLLEARKIPFIVLLLSEIFPAKLALLEDIDAWIQVACPRLSIDWGLAFEKPILSPYEAHVALGATAWRSVYPMDYYSDAGGEWSNYYERNAAKARKNNEKTQEKGVSTRKTVEISYETE